MGREYCLIHQDCHLQHLGPKPGYDETYIDLALGRIPFLHHKRLWVLNIKSDSESIRSV